MPERDTKGQRHRARRSSPPSTSVHVRPLTSTPRPTLPLRRSIRTHSACQGCTSGPRDWYEAPCMRDQKMEHTYTRPDSPVAPHNVANRPRSPFDQLDGCSDLETVSPTSRCSKLDRGPHTRREGLFTIRQELLRYTRHFTPRHTFHKGLGWARGYVRLRSSKARKTLLTPRMSRRALA